MQIWLGAAKRLDDFDIPRIGDLIGVGEDPIHAIMDVEARNNGFDSQGRVITLFEPHIFYRELKDVSKRQMAEEAGLAYLKWGTKPYPNDSYARIQLAMKIDETATLCSCSWGLGQIMGFNFNFAGFLS